MKRELAGIPCLVATPQAATGPLPTLLLYHGWGGSSEGYRFLAQALARDGFAVVCPEVLHHGVRGQLDYGSELAMLQFWEIVFAAVEESSLLLEALAQEDYVDAERIGIAGHSMGGTIASAIFAHTPRLKCLVSINGGPAFEMIDSMTRLAKQGPPISEVELELLRSYDPMNHVEQLTERPVLLLHGKADTSVPITVAEAFHDKATPHYAGARERLRFYKVERLNHFITLGMLEEMFMWLESHL